MLAHRRPHARYVVVSNDTMKKKSILDIVTHLQIPTKKEVSLAISSFNRSDWHIIGGMIVIMIISTIFILSTINKEIATVVPAHGGSFSEGIIGTPRFVNPVLATTNADKDIARLVYSGLMRKGDKGALIPDLASSYTVSDDGLTYTFDIRPDAVFHDGTPVTAEDILFTIDKIQDPLIKSPERSNWDGVELQEIDSQTISFTLEQPYISFLDNTTIGILPSHIWSTVSIEQFPFTEYNIGAIGSGPYKITDVNKKSSGIITDFSLKAFRDFTLGRPFIDSVHIEFFANESNLIRALENGSIDSAGALPSEYAASKKWNKHTVHTAPLTRTFAVFFNKQQNQIFQDARVVEALELALDKETIIELVLSGFGDAIDHPIPKTIIEFQTIETPTPDTSFAENLVKAEALLDSLGWKKGEDGIRQKDGKTLSFSLSTGNATELQQTAEIIREYYGNIGVQVELKIFELGNLNQNIIRPRNFDALFFGQIISKEADLYAFWHSSQIQDPGLNIAMYQNKTVDTLLENILKKAPTPERFKSYASLKKEMEKQVPALFIYSPHLIHITPKNIKNIRHDIVTEASDRYNMIHTWYIETDTVWNVFLQQK